MIYKTNIATLIEWLRGFDQTALVIDHGLFVVENQTTYEFPKSVPPHQEKEIITHPFVSTPNNGPCSSCGHKRSNKIHKEPKEGW